MITKGTYTIIYDTNKIKNRQYTITLSHTKTDVELLVEDETGVYSAYKHDTTNKYCYNNKLAYELYQMIVKGFSGKTAKNASPVPFALGIATMYEAKKWKNSKYNLMFYEETLCGAEITNIKKEKDDTASESVYLEYTPDKLEVPELKYIKLMQYEEFAESTHDIPVKSLDEISLTKDISWLLTKKYFIVNDDDACEKLISTLENWNGAIAYDTETTGLRINMFSKINSKEKRYLDQYNSERPEHERIYADSLVGVIFCVQENVSYYFPVANKKFKNVYEDKSSTVRNNLINRIKADYTIGEYRNLNTDMARYWRETKPYDVTSDCLFMERIRKILTEKHIVTHNGTFDWKVAYCYDIDTLIKDDTIIMHQLMYKFRSTTRNSGESSKLKDLAKLEFGIDQLDLKDFFSDYTEDTDGKVTDRKSKKKAKRKIDFSYMDYAGARAYAPADGDVTLALYHKYKKDLMENHREMEYIYQVELIVSQAVGYMEFYGHRIDVEKIEATKRKYQRTCLELEHKFRKLANLSTEKEDAVFDELNRLLQPPKQTKSLCVLTKEYRPVRKSLIAYQLNLYTTTEQLVAQKIKQCRDTIDNSENQLNLASPYQLSELFFDKMKMEQVNGRSIGKKSLKTLSKKKDETGKDKYPIIQVYKEWKVIDTLLTKFFDNLQDFMFPNGFIFPSYGQISTATGRMSCKTPNAQQYPKDITKIVIPRYNYIFLDADFSQIEYRTTVAMAKEPVLASLFENPDTDYHTLMASRMYGVPYETVTSQMRSDAKSFNFGIPFGMGFRSLAILLTGLGGQEQIETAKEKYELYFKDQPNVRKFFTQVKEMALVNKYTKTYWNRYRYYSFTDKDGKENEAIKAMALRQAGNAVIQGCLHGDTKIQTKEYGIVNIQDVVNQHLHVWDGNKWSDGDILYSGKKRKCVVKFTTGQLFICSPTHKFLVKSAKGNERFVECQDLRGRNISKNPHRVVINRNYEHSDWKCNSKINTLDIKHGIPKEIFQDTDMLRGYISTMVCLHGRMSGKTITLSFSNKPGFAFICQDIQKALLFFGIRCRHDKNKNKITISAYDNQKFLDLIGFISEEKQRDLKYAKNSVLNVESVEITDEYIDMYDVCNTDGGYYVADGIITHNTAADIFKISVARNFMWIRENRLYGDVLITNMVHDEQLIEINCDTINVRKAVVDIVNNMELKIANFPPLFVGAGIGNCWKDAKGKMAEMHPHMVDQLRAESQEVNETIRTDTPTANKDILKYFDRAVYSFRVNKIRDYLENPENHGKAIHPTIGSLLEQQFADGLEKELSGKELSNAVLEKFIKEHNLAVSIKDFETTERAEDKEEEIEYTDGEEIDDLEETDLETEYKLIDETDKVYGVTLQDIIKTFGVMKSAEQKVCGIDTTKIPVKNKERLLDLIELNETNDIENGLQVVFLQGGNILFRTGVYVSQSINETELLRLFK